MKNLLIASIVLASSITSTYGQGGIAIFQDGRDGYMGTEDVELFAGANVPRGLGLGDASSISVDESNGGFVGQGAMRFNDIFVGQGSNPTYTQIPLDVPIFFAEIRLLVTSPTADDASISFNRVLGADQNRIGGGPAIWDEQDTWLSLGGDQTVENGMLDEKPIEVGDSLVLGPNNEAFDATLSGTDPVTGEQFGILSQDQNDLDFDGDDLRTGASSVNVTNDVRLWRDALNEGTPQDINFGWAINNSTTNGWDFRTSEFDDGTPNVFETRPALVVAFGINGDLDGDLDIDGDDYRILRDNLGNTSVFRGEIGDLDFDTDVDLDDFWAFKDAFEAENPGASFADMVAAASVPEPSTVLTLMAAISLGLVGRRFKKAA